jgi:hypothetical protein
VLRLGILVTPEKSFVGGRRVGRREEEKRKEMDNARMDKLRRWMG